MHEAKAVLVVALIAVAGCDAGDKKDYEVINKDSDGRISIIHQSTGEMLVINKSNRVEDVISLDLSASEVEAIKKEKAAQDAAMKIREWPQYTISNTKYEVQLSTRYYKDRMLYRIRFSPSDGSSAQKARTISINLRDENGFVLEEINPYSNWVTVVNDKAKPVSEQANGEIPMTLDNYLQIANFDPSWRF